MASATIHPERVHLLAEGEVRAGRWVLYWMERSQRAEHNDALEHAVRRANALGLPVVVGFGVMDGYPGASLRHHRFMLEGLAGTARAVEQARVVAQELNGTYLLDGRDPSSFANVGWLFGLHDRPWKERPIFGTVRYMSASGLERKIDTEGYLRRVDGLAR